LVVRDEIVSGDAEQTARARIVEETEMRQKRLTTYQLSDFGDVEETKFPICGMSLDALSSGATSASTAARDLFAA
jgi:predicted transcriptional regulator